MILIINSKYGLIYGSKQLSEFYNIEPKEIIKNIDFNKISINNVFVDKINIKNRYFNINVEKILDNDDVLEYVVKIRENCCMSSIINFDIDTDLIIKNFVFENNQNDENNQNNENNQNELCNNCIKNKKIHENNNIINFNQEIYNYILKHKKQIINSNFETNNDMLYCNYENLIFLDAIFTNINDIEYLIYILYNKNDNTYKIKCKSLCDYLKNKIQTKVKTNISHNKNLFYHIFHEIRNYLNIITISTDNLYSLIENKFDKISEITEIEQIINFIKDSSKTIIEIMSDINTLDKLMSNQINIRKTFFMLDDLINSCVYSMQTYANNKEISFISENKINSVSLFGDYIRLKQVIINLISNAIKFTSKGGRVELLVNFIENNKKIQFMIKDNGIGIKKEHYNLIFMDFSQIDSEKLQNIGGTGLGLSIVKTIVELHGGTVGFNSIYNYGSEFYFNIPLIENDKNLIIKNKSIFNISTDSSTKSYNSIDSIDSSTKLYNSSEKKNDHEYKIDFCSKIRNNISDAINYTLNDLSTYKILFVDDNKTIQKISIKMFENLKINKIYIASNGLEAFQIYENEYLKNQPFDLIIMDQSMPIMDGNLSSNKIMELNPNAIIIGLTGNVLIEQKNEFIKNGVREIYEKPFTKEKLIELLLKYKKL